MSYSQLTEGERRAISHGRGQGLTSSQLARLLGRSRSTITREIERNMHHNGERRYYTYSKAHEKAIARRSRSRRNDRMGPEIWKIIADRIQHDWSPEQTANTLAKENVATVSHETIYRHLEKDKRQGGTLYTHLRHQRKKRRKRYGARDRRGRLAGKVMISSRPDVINRREEVGHWEMDTVMGRNSLHCLLTLIERKTGLTLIAKLTSRTAIEANRGLSALITSHPTFTFHSITSDNGSEFHSYKEIETKHQLTVYFAQPYHSWERGTNENTNGLIRQYLPKGKNMKWTTQEDCNHYAACLNSRPRKRLDWKSPATTMRELL